MRTTRIDIAGAAAGHHATVTRTPAGRSIHIEVSRPGQPDRSFQVEPGDREAIYRMAERLQHALDGVRGCGGDIREYFDVLNRLAD